MIYSIKLLTFSNQEKKMIDREIDEKFYFSIFIDDPITNVFTGLGI